MQLWQVVLYVTPLNTVFYVAVMAAAAVGLTRWVERRPDAARFIARMLCGACLFVILAATVLPTDPIGSGGSHHIWWRPGEGIWTAAADERPMIIAQQVANAAMFTPLAVLLFAALAKNPARRVAASMLLLGVGIEASQYLLNTGRVVDVDDLMCNTLGGLLGVGLMAAARALSHRQAGTRRHAHATPQS